MQLGADGIQSFEDAQGRRWRIVGDALALIERAVVPTLVDQGPPRGWSPLKLSQRREVYVAAPPDGPPLLLKRYPPRTGLLGRARDLLGTRAAAEFRMARRLFLQGQAIPPPLAWAEPSPGSTGAPAWFVSVRLLGVDALGGYLERRFAPGDRHPTKVALARHALSQLAALHRAGIWHRDFHGGNLLLREAEGPAGVLYLIDLHSALELGAVPAALRARDAADLLHSLRHAFAAEELAALVAESDAWELEPAILAAALERKRRANAASRAKRAFVESSRYAQTTLGGRPVSHERRIDVGEIARLLELHAAAVAGGERLLHRSERSRLTRQATTQGEPVVVKEFLGTGATRRARAAFRHTVAAQVRDLPVPAALAFIGSDANVVAGPAWFIATAVTGAIPLHLLALRPIEDDEDRACAAAIARRLLDLLVQLVARRFVHPDLSPKNILVRRTGARDAALTLVDLDAARPGRRWLRRRLLRALAQIGDLPERTFSQTDRLRFLADLANRLELVTSPAALARATAKILRRRRKLLPQPLPVLESGALPTLHLFGNWKWTGPAEPAVALAQALGPEARLLLGRCPFPDLGQPVAEQAAARGVAHAVTPALSKHWNPLRTARAAAAIVTAATAPPRPLVLHVHLDADHAAAAAARGHLAATAIVRTVHAAGPHPLRTRRLLARASELLLAPTRGLANELAQELHRPTGAVGVLETSVDLERFRSDDARRRRGRERLGLAADEVVFGVVARIQAHRRWDLLFNAWSELRAWAELKRLPKPPRLLLLGRGTLQEELAFEPVQRLGLEKLVVLPGYQEGDAYVEALAACDAGLFLVPGTDVSCRAVREWMAMGRPVIATRRPPLPELITDGVHGRLVAETPEELAAAVLELHDGSKRARMGDAALAQARARFSPARVATAIRLFDRMAVLALPGACAVCRGRADAVAAIAPGDLEAAMAWLEAQGIAAAHLLPFDPARSRDAVLDLFALLATSGARRLLVAADGISGGTPNDIIDTTVGDELAQRGIAVTTLARKE